MSFFVFATITCLPHAATEVRAALRENAAASRLEPGCRRYELFQSETAPEVLHVFEEYADPEAFEAHRASPHHGRYRAAVADKLAAPVAVVKMAALD